MSRGEERLLRRRFSSMSTAPARAGSSVDNLDRSEPCQQLQGVFCCRICVLQRAAFCKSMFWRHWTAQHIRRRCCVPEDITFASASRQCEFRQCPCKRHMAATRLEVVDAGGGAAVKDVLHDQQVHDAVAARALGALPARPHVLLRHLQPPHSRSRPVSTHFSTVESRCPCMGVGCRRLLVHSHHCGADLAKNVWRRAIQRDANLPGRRRGSWRGRCPGRAPAGSGSTPAPSPAGLPAQVHNAAAVNLCSQRNRDPASRAVMHSSGSLICHTNASTWIRRRQCNTGFEVQL